MYTVHVAYDHNLQNNNRHEGQAKYEVFHVLNSILGGQEDLYYHLHCYKHVERTMFCEKYAGGCKDAYFFTINDVQGNITRLISSPK